MFTGDRGWSEAKPRKQLRQHSHRLVDESAPNVYKEPDFRKALDRAAITLSVGAKMNRAATIVCSDAASLADAAAKRIIEASQTAMAASGRFTFVLSGGSTPAATYRALARPENAGRVNWSKTWLFFGDERFVPPDDDRSNYHMIRQTLLEPARIQPDHIYTVNTAGTPETAASDYEQKLRAFFASDSHPAFPRFDLILLGLGDDGHTASLFPGQPSLSESSRWVIASPPGILPPPVDRVTLTLPAINAAAEIMFLVAGENKSAILQSVLQSPDARQRYPAARVAPAAGSLTWLVDDAAASMLDPSRRTHAPSVSPVPRQGN